MPFEDGPAIDPALLRRTVDRLETAGRVTVLTGAGVSAASGVPTFRGPEGLWKTFRPETLATPEAFVRDPRLVWEWYDWRRQRLASCRPNRAHEVLAEWEARWPAFTLITQNVDGLHERAGSSRSVQLHGSIWDVSCWSRCAGAPRTWRDEQVPLPEIPARCPSCGGLARPAVVWFGEALDPAILARAIDAAGCDVFITAGTSSVVYPAAGLVHDARRRGAFTVEINPDATPATTAVDVALAGRAEIVLDVLGRQLAAGINARQG
jgi:NAD-dependent deacetylase